MKQMDSILKGNICYSLDAKNLVTKENGYLVCKDGLCAGVFDEVPEEYKGLPLRDYGNRIIIPGMVDLHTHAPQYSFRGLGMDLELLDWLNTHTFKEEAKFADSDYAHLVYEAFVRDLRNSTTTRACIFATVHEEQTRILMDLLEASGLMTYVGKVNMDQNAPDYLRETDDKKSAEDTLLWLKNIAGKYQRTKPILTPRFAPSCTGPLLERLHKVQEEYNLPVQSHLSENLSEIAWVKELFPESPFYGDVYNKYGMFGGSCKTVMAHCVSSCEEEISLMRERGVYIAHCPQSNTNLASGIAPVRLYLDQEVPMGLGSDVAGGTALSIFRAMADTIQMSKLRWRLTDQNLKPVTFEEAFYLATKGGGSFFGKVGSFEKNYEFDAVILDDSNLWTSLHLGIKERLEKMTYLSDERNVYGKYTGGILLFERN